MKKPSRYPNRASDSRELIYQILDETKFCTVACIENEEILQIPTGFCRVNESLYLHGSIKSHFLATLKQVGTADIVAFLFDGLVLAPTAFNHSVNYRSVSIRGNVEEVKDLKEKADILSVFTEKYIPGRTTDLPASTDEELMATMVLSVNLDEAVAKMRSGPVGVDTSKSNIWNGIIPAHVAYGLPMTDDRMGQGTSVPDYITEMVVKSNV